MRFALLMLLLGLFMTHATVSATFVNFQGKNQKTPFQKAQLGELEKSEEDYKNDGGNEEDIQNTEPEKLAQEVKGPVHYTDKESLNKLSFIRAKPEDVLGREQLLNYGKSILPSSMKLIEMMAAQLHEATQELNQQQASKSESGSTVSSNEQLAFNQTLTTLKNNFEAMFDRNTVQLVNSLGSSLNKVYLRPEERMIIPNFFNQEPKPLIDRLFNLIKLTSKVVFDDQVSALISRKLESSQSLFISEDMISDLIRSNERRTKPLRHNPRRNPQFDQLLDFITLLNWPSQDGVLPGKRSYITEIFSDYQKERSKEVSFDESGAYSSQIQPLDFGEMSQLSTLNYDELPRQIVEMNSNFVSNMSHVFRDMAMKQEVEYLVNKVLNLTIRQRKIENTTTFVEIPRQLIDLVKSEIPRQLIDSMKKNTAFQSNHNSMEYDMRLTYKFYTPRYPELMGYYGGEPQMDKQFQFYDPSSFNFREMRLFDDMVTKIIDEKEKWPPGFGANDGRIAHQLMELQQRSQNISSNQQCVKSPQKPGQCPAPSFTQDNSSAGALRPQFTPPFGSFMKDMFEKSKPSVFDFPIEENKITEKRELFLNECTKKAVKHTHSNFERLVKLLGRKPFASEETFQRILFTHDNQNHFMIKKMLGGLSPRIIQEIPSKNSHAKFFDQEVSISHSNILFKDPILQLEPTMSLIEIKSMQSQEGPRVLDVLTSSPEIEVFIEDGGSLPRNVSQSNPLKVNVMVTPLNTGRFDGLLMIVFESRVYVISIESSHVYPNKFGLRPIIYDRVMHRQEVSHPFVIANPFSHKIYIEEFYFTNSKFKADFKKNGGSQPTKNNPVNIIIEANSNRTLCNILFKNKYPPSIEESLITVKFSTGELIRVPFLVHTVNTIFETFPSIVDFGLVQIHQSPLRIPITASINLRDVKRVVDYHLPTDMVNIEFQIFDPPDQASDSEPPQRISERQRRQPYHKIDSNKISTFLVGHVVLNPVKAQFVSTSIKVELEMADSFNDSSKIPLQTDLVDREVLKEKIPHSKYNKTLFVEIPIIASVVNHTQMFSAISQNYTALRPDNSIPLPLYLADRKKSMGLPEMNSSVQGFIAHPDLLVKNNFNKPLVVQNIQTKASAKEEYEVAAGQGNLPVILTIKITDDRPGWYGLVKHEPKIEYLFKMHSNNHLIKQSPGSIVPYKQQDIEIHKPVFLSGQKLVWLKVDGVMVPQSVHIFDRTLMCQWKRPNDDRFSGSHYLNQSQTEGEMSISYSPSMDNKISYLGANKLIQEQQEAKDEEKPQNISWATFWSDEVVPCDSPMELDFGHVSLTNSKSATLVISNPNSVAFTLKSINQSKLLSAIKFFQIELVNVSGKQGKVLKPLWNRPGKIPKDFFGRYPHKPISLLSHSGAQQDDIGLVIPPFEKVHLKFSVKAIDDKAFKGVGTLATIEFAERDVSPITVLYKFKALEGQIEFKPEVMKFKPTFQGVLEYKVLTTVSNISQPVHIKSVRPMDPRIEVRIVNNVIDPWKMSLNGMVVFDASLTGSDQHKSEFLKSISQYSIENPPMMLKANKYGQFDHPQGRGRDQNNFDGNNYRTAKFSSLSDQQISHMIKNFERNLIPDGQNAIDLETLNLGDRLNDPFNTEQADTFLKNVGGQNKSPQGGPSVFASPEKDFRVTEGLNYRDILSWRERQQYWNQLQRQGKTSINTTIEIETDMHQLMVIPVEASLKKPEIVVSPAVINFGSVQIGTATSKHIKIHNPTQDPIQLQLFVATALDDPYFLGENLQSQKAWSDPLAFSDKILRQIQIFMNGVNLDLVQQVDYLFDTFKQQNASQVQINHKNLKKPSSRQNIIDILLRYTSKSKTQEKTRDSASIDDILYYWKKFDQELEHNYVGKYCQRIFLENSNIYEYASFTDYFEDIKRGDESILDPSDRIGWKEFVSQNLFVLSEHDNQIAQCLFSIQYVSKLNAKISLEAQKGETCSDYDFTIQSIQNYFKQVYQYTYDYDWKINNTMEKCNLTMPVRMEQLENLGSVESITKVLRSIFYYDTMQTWKRIQTANNRLKNQLREAKATQTAPIAQIQERYIQFQTYMIPFSHVQFQRYSTQEERLNLKQSLERVDNVIHQYKSLETQVEIQPMSVEQEQNQPDQVVKTLMKVIEKEQKAKLAEHNDITFSTLKDHFVDFCDFLGRLLGYDKYEYARVNQDDSQGIINPLSGINDRFQLSNSAIQNEMIRNNVWQRQKSFEGEQKRGRYKKADPPMQSFYLNPKYEGKVFTVQSQSNLTIENAVFFEPTMIEQDYSPEVQNEIDGIKSTLTKSDKGEISLSEAEYSSMNSLMKDLESQNTVDEISNKMQLLIKNNLTIIQQVDLKAHGGSSVLELVDIKKRFGDFAEVISVSESHTHHLVSMKDIPIDSIFERYHNYSQPFKSSEFFTDERHYLQNLLGGSDTHVIEYLFDQKTINEFERQKIQEAHGLNLSITQQIIANNYHQKNFLSKNDRFIFNLQQQSFKNYIMFNVPLTDIFMKKTFRQGLAEAKGFSEHEFLSLKDMKWEIFGAIPFVDDSNFGKYVIPKEQKDIEKQMKVMQQKDRLDENYDTLRKYIDPSIEKTALRYQVAQVLDRWDNQDFRVDINWTEFDSLLANKRHLKIRSSHSRMLVFKNTGSLPMKITSLMIDGTKCQTLPIINAPVRILNCQQIIKRDQIESMDNVTIELLYQEKFDFTRTSKVLTIDTEHFQQKFLIDFVVPIAAQELVKEAIYDNGLILDYKVESRAYLKNFSSIYFYLVQLFFLAYLFHLFRELVLTGNKVVDDYIMIQNGIFPILNTARVRVEGFDINRVGQPKTDAQKHFFESIEAEDLQVNSSSLLSGNQIWQEFKMINYCINSVHRPSDFENLVNKQHTTKPGTKFFKQVLPFEPKKSQQGAGMIGRDGSQSEKSVVFTTYQQTCKTYDSQIEAVESGLINLSANSFSRQVRDICSKPDLVILESLQQAEKMIREKEELRRQRKSAKQEQQIQQQRQEAEKAAKAQKAELYNQTQTANVKDPSQIPQVEEMKEGQPTKESLNLREKQEDTVEEAKIEKVEKPLSLYELKKKVRQNILVLENQILSKKQRKILIKENAEYESRIKEIEDSMPIEKQSQEKVEPDKINKRVEETQKISQNKDNSAKPSDSPAVENVKPEKKQKIKKLSKAELKKQEARFKEHEILTQNAKLLEERAKIAEMQRQKIKKLEESKRKEEAKEIEEKQEEKFEPSALIVDEGLQDIDIESYHSSQKSAKKRRAGHRDRDSDAFKGEKSQKSSEKKQEMARIGTDFDEESSQKNHSENEAYPRNQANLQRQTSKQSLSSLGLQPQDGDLHAEVDITGTSQADSSKDRIVPSRQNLASSGKKRTTPLIMNNDDNFWSNYEKNLGIVKEEPKEKSNSKPNSFQKPTSSLDDIDQADKSKIYQSDEFESKQSHQKQIAQISQEILQSRSQQDEEMLENESNLSQNRKSVESLINVSHDSINNNSEKKPQSDESQQEDNQISEEEMLYQDDEDEDPEAHLPLFQTKKYLEKLKKDDQDLKKKKAAQQAKRIETKTNVPQRGRGGKAEGEKRKKVYTPDETFDANLPEVAQQLLQKSRNLKADINNPNNPYYIGRPGNKGIETILNQKLKKQNLVVTKNSGEQETKREESKEKRERDRVVRTRDYETTVKDYDKSPEKREDDDHDLYAYEDEYNYKYKRDDRERYADPTSSYYQGPDRYSRYSRYEERTDPREDRYAHAKGVPINQKYSRYEQMPEASSYYRAERTERGRIRGTRIANDRFESQGFDEYGYYGSTALGRGRARGRAKTRGQDLYRESREYEEYGGYKPSKYNAQRYEAEDYYKREDSNDDYQPRSSQWIDSKDRYGARYEKYREMPEPTRGGLHDDNEEEHYERNITSYKTGRIAEKKKFDDREYYDRKEMEKEEEKSQPKFEPEATFLSKRGRGQKLSYLTNEPSERQAPYPVRGAGRGDRGSYLQRGRGSYQYPFTAGAYASQGRGRGAHYSSEAYQFKAKEKAEDKRSSKVELEPDQKPYPLPPKRKFFESHDHESSENFNVKFSDPPQILSRQKIDQRLANDQQSQDEYERPSMSQVQKSDANDHYEIEDQKQTQTKKSIYETFMDVSGMFSNPISSFGGSSIKQAKKSRFISETVESSEDEYDRNMATTANHAVNSIFSSDALFGSTPSSRNLNPVYQQHQQEQQQKQHNYPPSVFSFGNDQIFGSNTDSDRYDQGSQNTGAKSNQAGLSSSSFANLRRRALDSDRQDNILNSQSSAPKVENKPISFGGMEALPVPEFLKNRQQLQPQLYERQPPTFDSFQVPNVMAQDPRLIAQAQHPPQKVKPNRKERYDKFDSTETKKSQNKQGLQRGRDSDDDLENEERKVMDLIRDDSY